MTYTYRGYQILISSTTADVLAFRAGKLAFRAATEKDIESMIDSVSAL